MIRYPGCQCDIPAHNYAYYFEPNPHWPNYYATSEQIHEYMNNVTEKHKIRQFMQFGREIKSATWDEAQAKWRLRVEHSGKFFDDECDIFINAGGVLK